MLSTTRLKVEQTPCRKRRRKHQLKFTRPKVRKHAVESDKVCADSVTSGEREDSEAEDSDSDDDDESRECKVEVEEEAGDGEGGSDGEDPAGGGEDKDPHPEPVLRTECLYHVSCCVELLPDEPLEVQEEKEVVTGDQGKLHSLGWQLGRVTSPGLEARQGNLPWAGS